MLHANNECHNQPACPCGMINIFAFCLETQCILHNVLINGDGPEQTALIRWLLYAFLDHILHLDPFLVVLVLSMKKMQLLSNKQNTTLSELKEFYSWEQMLSS